MNILSPQQLALGELVTIRSRTGLELDGILYRSAGSRSTVVHVHGSFGNFYQGRLVKEMAKAYPSAGLNFCSVNMASHDGLAEGNWENEAFEYIGGAVATFDDCVDDIAGAVRFVEQFSDRVILQGHSLGCDRLLQYAIDEQAGNELILLAPCDSYQLQANWIAPETVEDQVARLKMLGAHKPLEWLPAREYGIKGGASWTYEIPVTRRAFLSIAEGPPYRLIRLQQPAQFTLKQRALVLIGSDDALQVWPSEHMFNYLRQRLGEVEDVVVSSGDHMFAGVEDRVSARVIDWVHREQHAK